MYFEDKVFDGEIYQNFNSHEFNKMLMRVNNVDFFLNLHALVKFKQMRMYLLLESFSDEVISRILYDTVRGVNIVEDIFYTIILPTFIYCIRNDKLHLVTANFNFLKYCKGQLNDIYEMVEYIAREVVSDVAFDMKLELIEKGDPLKMEPDFGPDNHLFFDNEEYVIFIARELSKFLHPFMKVFLANITPHTLTNLFDLFKTHLEREALNSIGQTFYDVGMNYAFVRIPSFGNRVLSLFNDGAFSQISNQIYFKEILESMVVA